MDSCLSVPTIPCSGLMRFSGLPVMMEEAGDCQDVATHQSY